MQFASILLLLVPSLLGQGPPQPPSFNPDGSKTISKEPFQQYEQEIGEAYNKYIPAKAGLRLMTWNVHMLLDVNGQVSNVDQVLREIDKVKPDAVVMQEVPIEGERVDQLVAGLPRIGLPFTTMGKSENGSLGVMVASSRPIRSSQTIQLGYKRVLLDACIIVNEEELHLLGTHLEVSDAQVRRQQAERIVQYTTKQAYASFALMGDFNSIWSGPAMEAFKTWGMAAESFRWLGWEPPSYTAWSGAQIDYVFVSDGLCGGRLVGAYVYHDGAASDHLALVVDVAEESALRVLAAVLGVAVVMVGLICLFMPSGAWYTALRNDEMAMWTDIYDD